MRTIIVWFRNDLRIHDHPALTQAINDAKSIIPVFILSDTILEGKFSSPNRNRFLKESLIDLKKSFQGKGGDLLILRGGPEEELAKLCKKTSAEAVYYTIDTTPYSLERDKKVSETLRKSSVAFTGFPGIFCVDSFTNIKTGNGDNYKVFTPFYNKWLSVTRREVLLAPDIITVPTDMKFGDVPQISQKDDDTLSLDPIVKGGETFAQELSKAYLNEERGNYEEARNILSEATSLLSPYLHFGNISPRSIEELLLSSKSGDALRRQLCWRDFYNYVLLHFPKNRNEEFRSEYRELSWSKNKDHLNAWKKGLTGYPVVDAAMRQLKECGWMHNRARLIVGSFLTKDLAIDWREGERHFMKWLLDGDEASNNGNWQWIASVGVDPSPVFQRIFNPSLQQERYDPDGSYVKKYVPELLKVPVSKLAKTWEMTIEEQIKYGCVIGKDYPAPIIDHALGRKATLERFRETSSRFKQSN